MKIDSRREKLEFFERNSDNLSMIDVKQATVIRTERGLVISGTRITLYDVLGYLKQDWSPKLVREWLNLTEEQMTDVLDYIENNQAEVETENNEVLAKAEENRVYWEKNARLRQVKSPKTSEKQELYDKLNARKAELGLK